MWQQLDVMRQRAGFWGVCKDTTEVFNLAALDLPPHTLLLIILQLQGEGGESIRGEDIRRKDRGRGRVERREEYLVFKLDRRRTSGWELKHHHHFKVCLSRLVMAPPFLLMLLMVVAMATGACSASEENELDYGYWNYREGADSVNVASVRSVTRVLDAWGKRIFREIKTLLHSEPSTLLPDYSRVRPLSESVNDLFREVSLLRRRITELSHRLATLEPFLRHHGYQEVQQEEEEAAGGGRALTPQTLRGELPSLARYTARTPGRPSPPRGTRVVRRRRVRVLNNGGVRVLQRGRERH